MTKKDWKPQYSFSRFFFNYFDNLGSLTLINLFMCIPLFAFAAVMWFVSQNLGYVSGFIVLAAIPLMSPFYAGAFYVSSRLTRREDVSFKDFIKGMKQNWISFLINSIFVYIITAGLYITFSFYRGGFGNPAIMCAFVVSLIFTLFFLFFEFGLMTMLVTVDIKISDALKNSVILVAGGLSEHCKALVSLLLVFFAVYSSLALSGGALAAIIILSVMCLLFLPMLSAYIVVYHVYRAVERIVISPFEERHPKSVKPENDAAETISQEKLAELSVGDPEEYVYLNGRMIKRKFVVKMLEVHSQKNS